MSKLCLCITQEQELQENPDLVEIRKVDDIQNIRKIHKQK